MPANFARVCAELETGAVTLARLQSSKRSGGWTVQRMDTISKVLAVPLRRFLLGLATLSVVCGAAAPRARAGVGVVLNESLDTSVARITGSGHSAVYFSRICPASPTKLRLCRPDEEGSVLSNYTTLGESQPFQWNVIPLSLYLYGVENPRNRPMFGSRKIKGVLEERYREKYLKSDCPGPPCTTSGKAEWREMVGASEERSIYIFAVDTTREQDLEMIAEFNALPNENHFNGVTQNCATFTRNVVNRYFPGAVSAEYLNDFGMTSPKAAARSFTRYAQQHPEKHFVVLHVSQTPGTIKRSSEARNGTEQLYHSKKLLLPMILFADHALPVVAASYLLTGRFNPEKTFEKSPVATGKALDRAANESEAPPDPASLDDPQEAAEAARDKIVGDDEEWRGYREAFKPIVAEAVHQEVIPNEGYLKHALRDLDEHGIPTVDARDEMWLDVMQDEKTTRVGLSASNIMAPESDSHFAYVILLAHIESVLKSPKHSRETMLEFQQDWAMLQQARRSQGPPPQP
ncbi:MAG: hypothetical protein WBE09_14150 [Candidatus Acidiferrales bacterium]